MMLRFAKNLELQISLEVILQTVFGLSEGERYQKLKRLLILITDVFQSSLTSAFLFFLFLQKDLGAWSLGEKFYV